MSNHEQIAGVDEAGRGPLAGPVVAAAVILNPQQPINGLTDSKQLTAKRRQLLYEKISNHSLAMAIGWAEVDEIDQINILQASLLAMQRAINQLTIKPNMVLIDGNRCPNITIPAQSIVGGDQTEPCISAASIIAKVTRDRQMLSYDALYPQYGFAQHKGYGTQQHYAALAKFGACPIHRRSFRLTPANNKT